MTNINEIFTLTRDTGINIFNADTFNLGNIGGVKKAIYNASGKLKWVMTASNVDSISGNVLVIRN